jgi:hypothetical protein
MIVAAMAMVVLMAVPGPMCMVVVMIFIVIVPISRVVAVPILMRHVQLPFDAPARPLT